MPDGPGGPPALGLAPGGQILPAGRICIRHTCAVTMQDLELEHAGLLPARETPLSLHALSEGRPGRRL